MDEVITEDPSVIGGIMEGSVSMSGNWKLKTTVFGDVFSISGEATTYVSGLKMQNHVTAVENTDGKVRLKSDRGSCKVDMENPRVTISHDKNETSNWLFQMFKMVASTKYNLQLNQQLTKLVCDVSTEVIGEITDELFGAMFDRELSLPIKSGSKINLDFRPATVYKEPSCLFIGSWTEIVEMVKAMFKMAETGSKPGQIPEKVIAFADQVAEWCTHDPTSNKETGSDISILLGQNVFSDVIKNLHQLKLLDLYLENRGNVENRLHFQVMQNENIVKTIELVLPRDMAYRFRRFYKKSIRISSMELPELTINEDGIVVRVKVKARFKMYYTNGRMTYDEEYHALTTWKGTLQLQRKNNKYSLVPKITVQAAQWEPQLRTWRVSHTLIRGGIARILNMVLEEKLSALMEEEVKSGFPVNIPGEYFRIGAAHVTYTTHHIILSAEDIIMDI